MILFFSSATLYRNRTPSFRDLASARAETFFALNATFLVVKLYYLSNR